MVEEKVIQQESVAPVEQSVTATDASQTTPPPTFDYQAQQTQIAALEKRALEAEKRAEETSKAFEGIKGKLDDVYKGKRKEMEDQGQFKPLWEEANKTNQAKDQQIADLNSQIEELRRSTETKDTRNDALAAISNAGAINAEQTLSLLERQLQKNAEGKTVILSGGVEQDLSTYINNLKQPSSGWEHHFKPSTTAGMGAKPTPNSTIAPGMDNPYKTGNLTQQMILSNNDPDLAAVLQREASQQQPPK
jgi:hypothetical protein